MTSPLLRLLERKQYSMICQIQCQVLLLGYKTITIGPGLNQEIIEFEDKLTITN